MFHLGYIKPFFNRTCEKTERVIQNIVNGPPVFSKLIWAKWAFFNKWTLTGPHVDKVVMGFQAYYTKS
jgi:hypothetical protein